LQQADFAGGVTTSAFGVGTKSKGYIKTGNADDEPFLDHSDFWEFDPSVTD
jgi:hypothetical protein